MSKLISKGNNMCQIACKREGISLWNQLYQQTVRITICLVLFAISIKKVFSYTALMNLPQCDGQWRIQFSKTL